MRVRLVSMLLLLHTAAGLPEFTRHLSPRCWWMPRAPAKASWATGFAARREYPVNSVCHDEGFTASACCQRQGNARMPEENDQN